MDYTGECRVPEGTGGSLGHGGRLKEGTRASATQTR